VGRRVICSYRSDSGCRSSSVRAEYCRSYHQVNRELRNGRTAAEISDVSIILLAGHGMEGSCTSNGLG